MTKIYTKFNVFAEANVNELVISDMKWQPLYKDNDMRDNDMIGYYCIMAVQDENYDITACKYTALFQHPENELSTGNINKSEIEQYILFEKKYDDVIGDLQYPYPDDEKKWITFSIEDINDYGCFLHAYRSYEAARRRALFEFKKNYQRMA